MVGEETLSVWPGVKVGGWGDPLLPLKSNDIHCLPELELPTCDMGTPTVLSGLTAKRLDSSFSAQFLYCSLHQVPFFGETAQAGKETTSDDHPPELEHYLPLALQLLLPGLCDLAQATSFQRMAVVL